MQSESQDRPDDRPGGTGETDSSAETIEQPGTIARSVQSLLHMGLGELLTRLATNLFSIAAIVIVVWLARLYLTRPSSRAPQPTIPAATAPANLPSQGSAPEDVASAGIGRQADLHTNVPQRARQDIVMYTVQKGDTVSGIADRFGLQPKTVFAANYDVLQDDPHNLLPDQQLRILPVDGVYWEWLGGIPFGQWAAYFKVKPLDIINYPPNHLDAAVVGDPENANIKADTFLIIPGGEYQYHTPGQVPLGITRSNPATAQVGGAGACPAITGGAIGTGTFVYPTDRHYLSGYE
jgi:LysM repeat protein